MPHLFDLVLSNRLPSCRLYLIVIPNHIHVPIRIRIRIDSIGIHFMANCCRLLLAVPPPPPPSTPLQPAHPLKQRASLY